MTFNMAKEHMDYLRRVAIKQQVPAGMRQREFLEEVKRRANHVGGFILTGAPDEVIYNYAKENAEFLPEGEILVNLLIKCRNELEGNDNE